MEAADLCLDVSNSPIQIACRCWLEWNPGGDFAALVAGYLAKGWVYSGDECFILAQAQGDQWYIHLAAGRIDRFMELAPFKLPFVAFDRKCMGKARRYSWNRVERLLRRT